MTESLEYEHGRDDVTRTNRGYQTCIKRTSVYKCQENSQKRWKLPTITNFYVLIYEEVRRECRREGVGEGSGSF